MKVLLTGGSSFTGTWFARALRERGHDVLATLRSPAAAYEGRRQERIAALRDAGVQFAEGVSFGDDRFIELVWGVQAVCHHAAQVSDYKSLDFDVAAAVRDNTRNARAVLSAAQAAGVGAVMVTGSVFEQDEGAGTAPMRAFSPYGLSKGLSWQVLRYWAEQLGQPVHKFVIANPFGPHEEPRFCAYLLQQWSAGKSASVGTPAYVRDNIHVSLLAKSYAAFVERCASRPADAPGLRLAPSGYAETQGAFAQRFAREIGARLGIETPLELAEQTQFTEPFARIATDRPDAAALGWSEPAAWDELAAYYRRAYLRG